MSIYDKTHYNTGKLISLQLIKINGKKIRLTVFILLNFKSSLYILDTSPLLNISFVSIFSQSVAYLLILLTVSFTEQEKFFFMEAWLSIIIFHWKCFRCHIFLTHAYFPSSVHTSHSFPYFDLLIPTIFLSLDSFPQLSVKVEIQEINETVQRLPKFQ